VISYGNWSHTFKRLAARIDKIDMEKWKQTQDRQSNHKKIIANKDEKITTPH
jgi:hypothetical protein